MKYKYFSEKEIEGLQQKLVQMLDRAREYSGIPYKLTSTVRSIEHNHDIGGVEDSSHIKGLAVDISAETSQQKFKILLGLIAIGFKRIGVYKHHIHCDIDNLKAQDVLWCG